MKNTSLPLWRCPEFLAEDPLGHPADQAPGPADKPVTWSGRMPAKIIPKPEVVNGTITTPFPYPKS